MPVSIRPHGDLGKGSTIASVDAKGGGCCSGGDAGGHGQGETEVGNGQAQQSTGSGTLRGAASGGGSGDSCAALLPVRQAPSQQSPSPSALSVRTAPTTRAPQVFLCTHRLFLSCRRASERPHTVSNFVWQVGSQECSQDASSLGAEGEEFLKQAINLEAASYGDLARESRGGQSLSVAAAMLEQKEIPNATTSEALQGEAVDEVGQDGATNGARKRRRGAAA